MGVGDARRLHDFFKTGVRIAVTDVFADGAGEENRILRDNTDLTAQIAQFDLADIGVVDLDAPVVHVVETGDQVDGGGLADPGPADQADHLAGLDFEADVVEHWFALVVSEGHLVKADFP